MTRRTIIRRLLYTLGSLAIILSLATWIFLSFYFEKTLNTVVVPKLEQATFKATHGRFTLTLDKISYAHGRLVCNTFILTRVAYAGGEHGLVLGHMTLDSARFEGISWWDVLWGNDLALTSLQLDAPRAYMTNADSDIVLPRIQPAASAPSISKISLISFDSVVLRNADVYLPQRAGNASEPAYRNITVWLTDFSLDPSHKVVIPSLFSGHVEFNFPGGDYPIGDSTYSIHVRGIHGSLTDSLVTIDSLSYLPNYNEQAFADLHKYFQDRLEYRCNGIRVRGIDFSKLMGSAGLFVRLFEVTSWSVDYYGDMRKAHNPHPVVAVLPHTIVNGITSAITIDSIVMNNGHIQHRERIAGSTHASLLTFTHARVTAHPFSTDHSSTYYKAPLQISVSALFLDQARVLGTIIYPIHDRSFNLHVDATVSAFDLTRLNSYLISNERKEITSGKCLASTLSMDVRSGTATTTVCPRYSDVSMRVLATNVKEKRGFMEGLKSFIANTFVLRTNNVDDGSSKAFSGTTTYVRQNTQEFFEFIWLALRKSIQKVVGF
ncbi:MAG: hypothetical protein Q8922_07965 [Bacteroidota bacterium]|nr:hypothetical protein [Bacteroidota bacterium]MDP4234159.1 hypothetical protein [Bacteroidota bacterium]MDP4244019.1 hypothetical protein [Bacteroidota bacterium]MDP4287859.1 hypothetical protein [Bacteroidota bacterium]